MTSDETPAFIAILDDLGTVFPNLADLGDRAIAVWWRSFEAVDLEILRLAADRCIRDHDAPRLSPAALRTYVDDERRDRAMKASTDRDTAAPPAHADPECPRCGGTGKFRATLDLGDGPIAFSVICTRTPANG